MRNPSAYESPYQVGAMGIPKRVMEKKLVAWLVYSPVAVFTLLGIINSVVDLPLGTLRAPAALFLGIIFVGYFVLSLAALVHSFVTAGPGERAAEGLHFMLAGVVAGLLPLTVMIVAGLFVRTDTLPGGDLVFVPLILIPISFAAALLKAAGASPRATVTR